MGLKFYFIVAAILLILGGVKLYVYRRLRTHFMFARRRWLLIALLGVLAVGELALFVIRDSQMNGLEYIAFGSCVVLTYCLFWACVSGDVVRWLARAWERLWRRSKEACNSTESNKPREPETLESTSKQDSEADSKFLESPLKHDTQSAVDSESLENNLIGKQSAPISSSFRRTSGITSAVQERACEPTLANSSANIGADSETLENDLTTKHSAVVSQSFRSKAELASAAAIPRGAKHNSEAEIESRRDSERPPQGFRRRSGICSRESIPSVCNSANSSANIGADSESLENDLMSKQSALISQSFRSKAELASAAAIPRGAKHNSEAIMNSSAIIESTRRKFLKLILDIGVALLFVGFVFRSFSNALSTPPVREVRVQIPKLGRKKHIVLISDVHIGKALGREFLSRVVARINALEPDMVVIVGDLVDDRIGNVRGDLEPLRELQSREGVYYVAGNHEYYHGVRSITRYVEGLGIRVLHNTSLELEDVNLAGVSDLAGLRFGVLKPDLESARRNLNADKPSILLAHQPKFVRKHDVSDFDLVLCGHTHAGQVFPLSLIVWIDQRYIHGLYTLPRRKAQNTESSEAMESKEPRTTQLYVSSGVGFWGPAIRFLAPSEIVSLRLQGA